MCELLSDASLRPGRPPAPPTAEATIPSERLYEERPDVARPMCLIGRYRKPAMPGKEWPSCRS